MRILFVHQNFPGQYGNLAGALAGIPGYEVKAIGDGATAGQRPQVPGVELVAYKSPAGPSSGTHHYVRPLEGAVRRGQTVARACFELQKRKFSPDLICAHPGWGEALFLKDVFPAAQIQLYCEFYYRARGADVAFDPEFPATPDDVLRVRVKNAASLLSMEAADHATSPTEWQRSTFPEWFRDRIDVVHEGVDTDWVKPAADARIELPDGKVLTSQDEVVTYVARNLEPYRGFHSFMRSLPEIQRRRPRAHTLIVGGNDVSYGVRPRDGATYKEQLLKELEGRIDLSRVHFVDRVSYGTLVNIYRVSKAHVYLTYPFVLSWSLLEAMSAGCVVVGSRTPPVQEVIADGDNGLLVDFFNPAEIAARVDEAVQRAPQLGALRERARRTVVDRYDLRRVCLPRQLSLLGVETMGLSGDPRRALSRSP